MSIGSTEVITTTDYGQRWAAVQAPSLASGDRLRAVSCASSTACFVASQGGGLFKTTDAGSGWQAQSLPKPVYGLTAVWCLDSYHCWAPGTSGPQVIYRTVDGGAHWLSTSLYQTGGEVQSVSCLTSALCVAAGSITTNPMRPALFRSTDGGATWTVAATYPTTYGGVFTSVSCANADDCTAVGYNNAADPLLFVSTDAGAHWSSEATPTGLQQLLSVSCVVATGCWAVGFEGDGTPTFTALVVHSGLAGTAGTTSYSSTTASFDSIACTAQGPCWVSGLRRGGPTSQGEILTDHTR